MMIQTGILAIAILLAFFASGCGKTPGATEPSPSAGTAANTASRPSPAGGTTAKLEPSECGTISRMYTFGDVSLASQPASADFELVRQSGVRTVINQRHESEITDFDERALVASLGMQYLNPAFADPAELTDALIDETRKMLRTAERPVLMHCGSANRTGAIWLAYRVLDDGLGVDEAVAEAKTVGLRSPAYEQIVRDYIERHR